MNQKEMSGYDPTTTVVVRRTQYSGARTTPVCMTTTTNCFDDITDSSSALVHLLGWVSVSEPHTSFLTLPHIVLHYHSSLSQVSGLPPSPERYAREIMTMLAECGEGKYLHFEGSKYVVLVCVWIIASLCV